MFSYYRKNLLSLMDIKPSFMKLQSQLFGILVTLYFNHFNSTDCNKLIWDSCRTNIYFHKAFHSN